HYQAAVQAQHAIGVAGVGNAAAHAAGEGRPAQALRQAAQVEPFQPGAELEAGALAIAWRLPAQLLQGDAAAQGVGSAGPDQAQFAAGTAELEARRAQADAVEGGAVPGQPAG